MKVSKSFGLFCLLLLGISSCFEPPEFSDGPEISLNKIEFKVTPAFEEADTLILYIDFKDGDGDLGFNKNNLQHFSDPYHPYTYFLETADGGIRPVATEEVQITAPSPIPQKVSLLKASGPAGKLVTNRTRSKPGYGFLPPLDPSKLACQDYIVSYLIIPPELLSSIDTTYNVVATSGSGAVLIQDTLYFDTNRNYFNIRVRFYQKINGVLQEFSWEDEFCSTFNGRLPILSDSNNPLEGTIKYNMQSLGFLSLFSVKTLALDIIISDRSLKSDSIRSDEFTLDQKRVN
ncbi:MAG: hypothetical protein HRU69_13490 [Flammeovirgaceae bacterium]|nr:MAG: hypothetical protein HRU69_13490 [Flammeovirgaceae bacterium]